MLIYLLNYKKKQDKKCALIIYKNLYYLLIEKLYYEQNDNINSEQMINYIFNLIKIARIIKIKNKHMKKLFQMLQNYIEKFNDFHFYLFNKIFLFIYEDTKTENKIFLKTYLNKYFNDRKIISHIFNHVWNYSKGSKFLLSQKQNQNEGTENKKDFNKIDDGISPFVYSEDVCENMHMTKSNNINNINNNNNNSEYSQSICYFEKEKRKERKNLINHNNISHMELIKNEEEKLQHINLMKYSNDMNEEIIKKISLKYKNLYSSDSNSNCSSHGRVFFKTTYVKHKNYRMYEKEKRQIFIKKLKERSMLYYKKHKKINSEKKKKKHIVEDYSSDEFSYFVNESFIHFETNLKKKNYNQKIMQLNIIGSYKDYNNIDILNNVNVNINSSSSSFGSSSLSSSSFSSSSSSKSYKSSRNISDVNNDLDKKRGDKKVTNNYERNDDRCNMDVNRKKKRKNNICFCINNLNGNNSENFLSLLSNADIRNVQKNDEKMLYVQNEEYLYRHNNKYYNNDIYKNRMGNKKDEYKIYSRLLKMPHDNSCCLIKYKAHYEFDDNRKNKVKKEREKERKQRETQIMCLPLYISIVGGLDIFLYNYYNYICNMYINPYFYINTYYFEK